MPRLPPFVLLLLPTTNRTQQQQQQRKRARLLRRLRKHDHQATAAAAAVTYTAATSSTSFLPSFSLSLPRRHDKGRDKLVYFRPRVDGHEKEGVGRLDEAFAIEVRREGGRDVGGDASLLTGDSLV